MKNHQFRTRAIHAGQEADATTGSTIIPIHPSTTFTQSAPGEHKGYEYSRTGNPTRAALEECLATLDGGLFGAAFASGMAATTAVANLLSPGDHLIVGAEVYGGTYRLFSGIFERWGITTTYVQSREAKDFAKAVTSKTRMIWIETPTNPLLNILDIASLAEISRNSEIMLVVDNTFATPYLQKPLSMGADIVVYSTTKYLNGHSDVIGGSVITSNEPVFEQVKYYQNAAGAVPSPFDCWLLLRGLKTLAARMEAHQLGAEKVATFLLEHPAVSKVLYPGLESHKGPQLAKKQMSGWGGMVSMEMHDPSLLDRFFRNLELFAVAESLGGVESLACHPYSMTHASMPKDLREAIGITSGLVRLSVGLEDPDDLVADLRYALES